ncbi:hypothetical protein [Burkholderia sp. Ac-20365]|nr:hypothetical protein [Burkholderia sp. Ac-20365]
MRKLAIKQSVTVAVLLGAMLGLSGCNTIAGIGEDITGASRSVQRAL